VVAEMADRVAVMYKGRLVEEGPVRQILRSPAHEYTRGLLAAVPGMKTGGPEGPPLRADRLSGGGPSGPPGTR
jgi:ABC-type dipeptide/oligopeptide/nickel transport system ATPase component